MGITIVTRKIERTFTEAGKAAMKNLIRTNDLTASKRVDEKGNSKIVFKVSNQKFSDMGLNNYALTAGVNESGNVFLIVVPSDTDGAIMKGKKGAKKSQEFVYKELESLLNIQDDKHGFNLTRNTDEEVDGVISVWEVTPAELIRKPEKSTTVEAQVAEDFDDESEENDEDGWES